MNDWKGACHATCGVLHVLLNEQRIENELVLGEAQLGSAYFNHSWIEINRNVFDMAIGNTLIQGFHSSPVFENIDIDTQQPSQIRYGVNSGLADDTPTFFVKSQSLGAYLNKAPIHPQHGFWILVLDIGTKLGLNLNLIHLKSKYSTVSWVVR